MRIGWITSAADSFGVRQATLGMAGALRAAGWDPLMVLLGEGAFARDCQQAGLEVLQPGIADAPWVRRSSVLRNVAEVLEQKRHARKAGFRLAAVLRDRGLDWLHFRHQNLIGIAGRVARGLRLPCFWHLPNALGANYPFHVNRLLYQLQCRLFGIIPIANSTYTRATIGDALVQPEVLPLGADVRRFDPATVRPVTRAEIGIPPEAIVFGLFARIHPEKGQVEMVRALASIAQQPPLHLLALGGPLDNEYAAQIRAAASATGFGDRLHLIGAVSDAERYHDVVDIGVNARIDAEPFGLSVIESMMMRRPMLVHALGGPGETVLDGRTGWHVHTPTADGFAHGIRRVLADRPRWREMGEAARQHALANYTMDAVARNYQSIVRRRLGAEGDKG